MVIFKPDGSHGMYSWLHFSLATASAPDRDQVTLPQLLLHLADRHTEQLGDPG
jgi:hypothetical protein